MANTTKNTTPDYRLKIEDEEDLHNQALVWNPILAVVDSMVIKCAVKLHLFDSIHRCDGDRPVSLPELAASLAVTSPDRLSILRRLLRYLAYLRLVDVHPGDSYTLTAASSIYLREGSEKSHAAYVRFFVEEDMLAALHTIHASLGGGEEADTMAARKSGGENLLEWMARDTAVNSRFNAAMLDTVRPIIEAVLKGCPEVFQGVKVLVDVGGGTGFAAAAIATAFSGIRCIVYDMPCVVANAPEWEAVEYEAGNMHVSVPHGDALMFVRVLHVCDDEKALQILNRCREAIFEEKGKLIIIDDVISEADAKELLHVKLAYDLMFLQFFGGKERTEKDWRSLLLKAGFTHCRITRVMALQHVIEA